MFSKSKLLASPWKLQVTASAVYHYLCEISENPFSLPAKSCAFHPISSGSPLRVRHTVLLTGFSDIWSCSYVLLLSDLLVSLTVPSPFPQVTCSHTASVLAVDASRSSSPLEIVWHHYGLHYTAWWDFTCHTAPDNASSRSAIASYSPEKLRGWMCPWTLIKDCMRDPSIAPTPSSGGLTQSRPVKGPRAAFCLGEVLPLLPAWETQLRLSLLCFLAESI